MSALLEWLIVPIEAVINRGIAMSPEATEAALQLDNRSMRVASLTPDVNLCVSVTKGRISLQLDKEEKVDVELSGSALELNRLLFIDERAPVREGQVSIKGSSEIAEQFRELFRLAGPEPERQLARLIGAPAAFQLSNAAKSAAHWISGVAHSSADHLSDILQEDSELLPTPEEVDQFNEDVDEASDNLARLEARYRRLARAVDVSAVGKS